MKDLRNYKPTALLKYIDKQNRSIKFLRESLTTDNKVVDAYEIPELLQSHPLLLSALTFSQHPSFFKMSPGTQFQYVTSIRKLAELGLFKPSEFSTKDQGLITPNFRNYLRTKDLSRDSIARHIANIRKILVFACDPVNDCSNEDWWTEDLRAILQHTELVTPTKHNQKKTIKDTFPTSKYHDEEILMSLRRVSLWFLNMFADMRDTINQHLPNIGDQLYEVYDHRPLRKCNLIKLGGFSNNLNERLLTSRILDFALSEDNDILCEFLYYSRREFLLNAFGSEPASQNDITREISSMFEVDASKRRKSHRKIIADLPVIGHHYNSPSLGKRVNLTSFTGFSPLNSIHPTLAEQRMLSLFLASERMHATAIDNIKLIDLNFSNHDRWDNARSLQIEWVKGRGNSRLTTPVYKKGEPAFRVISHMKEIVRNAEKIFGKTERPGKLLQTKNNRLIHSITKVTASSVLPMTLLGLEGSRIRKYCLESVEGAKPFLDVLSHIARSNYALTLQQKQYSSLMNKARNDRTIDRKSIVTEGMKHVSISAVNQSRAILEDDFEDEPEVTAALASHSRKTHENVYLARSDLSKKISGKAKVFGEMVGDEMIALARTVSGFRENVVNMTSNDIRRELGLSYNPNEMPDTFETIDELIEEALREGLDTSILGEISTKDTTYIIQSPITAALMLAFIDHINVQLPSLSRNSETKYRLAKVHQLYLKTLLERFPKRILKEARKIVTQTTFPFPSLL